MIPCSSDWAVRVRTGPEWTPCGNCGEQLLSEYCFAPSCQTFNQSQRFLKEKTADDERYRQNRLASYINTLNKLREQGAV